MRRSSGRTSDGGGWRVYGRDGEINRSYKTGLAYEKVHNAVDDHARLAFVQVHADEKGPTCAKFVAVSVAWFAAQGIVIERVMTDNSKNYTVSRDI